MKWNKSMHFTNKTKNLTITVIVQDDTDHDQIQEEVDLFHQDEVHVPADIQTAEAEETNLKNISNETIQKTENDHVPEVIVVDGAEEAVYTQCRVIQMIQLITKIIIKMKMQ